MLTLQEKKQLLQKLKENFSNAEAIIFTNFAHLSTAEQQELRRQLQEFDALYTVTKNTLLNLAAEQTNYGTIAPEILAGPTAVIFSRHQTIAILKKLTQFIKEYEKPEIKGGFWGKRLLSAAQINKIAHLPSEEIIKAQVISAIQAPLRNSLYILQAPLYQLASLLKIIAEEKGGENNE